MRDDVHIVERALDKISDEYNRLKMTTPVIRKIGLHPAWNAVIGSEGACGIAMSFRSNNPNYCDGDTFFDPAELRPFVGMTIPDMIRETMPKQNIRMNSLLISALNALSQPLLTEERLLSMGYNTCPDTTGLVKSDDTVVIVGYGGLVSEYAGTCRQLHVTDMRPVETFTSLVIGEDIHYGPAGISLHTEKDNKELLAGADVVFITGSTLANGTFEEVVRDSEDARIRCLYGSTAQLIPDLLFDYGINLVMSVQITDPVRFEFDVLNSADLETALKRHQKKYSVSDGSL